MEVIKQAVEQTRRPSNEAYWAGPTHAQPALCPQGPQAMEVMKQAVEWSRSADPSFVRHFVFQALGVAFPPYHPDFATILLQ